ncbi:hypothetical protein [Mycolicibacter algericus]|uniref:Head-to-tail adaptor n=2 Tax=Mycolicibacter algericus TaxID=1288388 RepID=A0A7I9Y3Y9_MYCAL|nr:hypothetical protein [Mycolicibacter algericus]OQZ96919.1 hypothetical protein BST10_10100 [Mycolicibacter algericus DSM 45454]GFG83385.1 hypothetical protein MALGJ_00610 [Mycolicibacter algericus]
MTAPSSHAELTAFDIETYTRGRLKDDESTEQLLAAALVSARRWCGWHVSPVRVDDELEVDGPGARVLSLPTMRLLSVKEIDDDGQVYGPDELRFSRSWGTVAKRNRMRWSSGLGAVRAVVTHGYTDDQAADFRLGVMRLVDLMSRELTDPKRESADMIGKRVDDVERSWSATSGGAAGLTLGVSLISNHQRLAAIFAPFQIIPSP